MARRSLSGGRRVSAEPAPAVVRRAVAASAGAEAARMGAATAVTAEADRNVRRGEPPGPRNPLFFLSCNIHKFHPAVNPSPLLFGTAPRAFCPKLRPS